MNKTDNIRVQDTPRSEAILTLCEQNDMDNEQGQNAAEESSRWRMPLIILAVSSVFIIFRDCRSHRLIPDSAILLCAIPAVNILILKPGIRLKVTKPCSQKANNSAIIFSGNNSKLTRYELVLELCKGGGRT